MAEITLLGLSSREIYGNLNLPAFVPDRDEYFKRQKSKIDLNTLYDDIYSGSLPGHVSGQITRDLAFTRRFPIFYHNS